jgi:hypothetical protein
VIYFIEAVGLDLVKIGFSRHHPLDRDMAFCPVEYRLIYAIEGSRCDEQDLHRRFRRQRHRRFGHYTARGEWFRLSPLRQAIFAMPSLDVLPDRGRVGLQGLCGDCGARIPRGDRNERCRSCSGKARALMHVKEVTVSPTCIECSRPRARSAKSHRGPGSDRGLCRPCAMRAAWADPIYRHRVTTARLLARQAKTSERRGAFS